MRNKLVALILALLLTVSPGTTQARHHGGGSVFGAFVAGAIIAGALGNSGCSRGQYYTQPVYYYPQPTCYSGYGSYYDQYGYAQQPYYGQRRYYAPIFDPRYLNSTYTDPYTGIRRGREINQRPGYYYGY